MKLTIIFLTVIFLLGACTARQEQQEQTPPERAVDTVPDMHTSKISLDYTGEYKGLLPCEGCEGINTYILLNDDYTFVKKTDYLGLDDSTVYEFRGKYSWNDAGNTITLEGVEAPNQYFVGENMLIALDAKGQRIREVDEKYHILEKQQQ